MLNLIVLNFYYVLNIALQIVQMCHVTSATILVNAWSVLQMIQSNILQPAVIPVMVNPHGFLQHQDQQREQISTQNYNNLTYFRCL